MLLIGPVLLFGDVLGIFTWAKSRCGSRAVVIEVGRYDPMRDDTLETIPWDTCRKREARPSAKVDGLRSSVGGPANGETEEARESERSSSSF